jgi:asparagine synthase (glutamine-hydrolysing)
MLGPLVPHTPGAPFRDTISSGRAMLAAAAARDGIAGSARLERAGGPLAAVLCGALHGNGGGPASGNKAAAMILDRYAAVGIDVLRELRGEFSLAIWDPGAGALHLATDPFRTQPLFYSVSPQGLAFASRMRSLQAAPIPPGSAIDPWSVVDVIASSYVPTPRTIYRDIRKLPPGHRLTHRAGQAEVRPYWDLDFLHPSAEPFPVLAGRVRDVLSGSVADRLGVDAEGARRVGTFLSGGVDSSTVTRLVGDLTRRPASCFTIAFDEARYNEVNYARIAARAFAADHHERVVTPGDVTEILPVLRDAFDEPFANASAIPTYFCARLAKENGIDVLYAGDGGDELFAGNERYASRRVFDRYRSIPRWARRITLEPLVAAAAAGTRSHFFERAKRFIDRANGTHFERITAHNLLRLHPVSEFFRDDFVASLGDFTPYDAERRHCDRAPAATDLDRELYLDLKLAISDNDIIKVTRMCEAAGVEVRFPFLDRAVAEFAATVPAALKMRGGALRWFFKEAYADLLPVEVRTKTKHGFGLPIPIWLRTEPALRDMVRDLVLGPDCRSAAYLRPAALRDLVAHHERDTSSFYGTILWNVLTLELFLRSEDARTRA